MRGWGSEGPDADAPLTRQDTSAPNAIPYSLSSCLPRPYAAVISSATPSWVSHGVEERHVKAGGAAESWRSFAFPSLRLSLFPLRPLSGDADGDSGPLAASTDDGDAFFFLPFSSCSFSLFSFSLVA